MALQPLALEQLTVEPFQQWAVQLALRVMRGRLAASCGCGEVPRSGAGAKIAAREASPANSSGVTASAGQAPNARANPVNPRSNLLFIFSPP
jgi:hypothetical protein